MTLIQMLRPLLTCLALAAYSATLLADAPIIAVDAIYPPILSTQHDNRVKVTSGRFTQDIEGLVFSDPRITAVLDAAPNLPLDDQPQKQFGSFNIKVDPSLPEGFYEVAAVGRYGISNTRILAVLHTPVELIPGNIDPKSPPEVKPGTCYVGLTKRSDNVLLKAKKTDHWPKCLVVAQTLDTWTIPSLIVSDSSNRVLNQLRGQGKQPILFTKPVNEPKEPVDDVLFRVHDFLYRAGDPFAFALVIDPADNHLLLQPTPANPIYSIFQDPIPQWPIIDANSLGAIKTLPPPPWQTTIELLPSNSPYELEFPVAENASYECEVFSSAIGQLSDIRVVADRIAPPFTPEQIAEIQGALSAPAGSNIEPALQQRIKDYKARTTAIGREVFNVAEDGINAGTKAVRLLSPDPLFAIPAGPTDKHVRLRIEDLQLTPSAKKPTRVVVRVGPPTPRFHAVGHWIPDKIGRAHV
mgnify:CR=1 FL=1